MVPVPEHPVVVAEAVPVVAEAAITAVLRVRVPVAVEMHRVLSAVAVLSVSTVSRRQPAAMKSSR